MGMGLVAPITNWRRDKGDIGIVIQKTNGILNFFVITNRAWTKKKKKGTYAVGEETESRRRNKMGRKQQQMREWCGEKWKMGGAGKKKKAWENKKSKTKPSNASLFLPLCLALKPAKCGRKGHTGSLEWHHPSPGSHVATMHEEGIGNSFLPFFFAAVRSLFSSARLPKMTSTYLLFDAICQNKERKGKKGPTDPTQNVTSQ
ncbi:hypothetical protein MAPG_05685 [Magnaporthiopsis poae ATCC 64411]|uniref:Uncharacterized protein n=1 Tax=Magnaporthiopsis poae (strain ATCC 64411 / 73-15) TaxID=644358 RepID=A0A0C4E019_MAGP6|nr:hypothetical protein MAPG_05685 [Magnaporthiopsis poae ATCC 64411]